MGVLFILLTSAFQGLGQSACTPVLNEDLDIYISNFTLDGIPNLNYGKGAPSGYTNEFFNYSKVSSLLRGETYNYSITITANKHNFLNGGLDESFSGQLYLDFGDNSSFNLTEFAGTEVYQYPTNFFGETQTLTLTGQFTVPAFASLGRSLLRVHTYYDVDGSHNECLPVHNQVADYIDFRVNILCNYTTQTNNAFIHEVQLGNERGPVIQHTGSGIGTDDGRPNYENLMDEPGFYSDIFQGDSLDASVEFYGDANVTYNAFIGLDYENDGDFEKVFNLGSVTLAPNSTEHTFTGKIGIETNQDVQRNCRIRVIVTTGTMVTGCEGLSNGEIHEYLAKLRCPTYGFDWAYNGTEQPDSIQVFPGQDEVPVLNFSFSADEGCEDIVWPQQIVFKPGLTSDITQIENYTLHYNTTDDFAGSSILDFGALTATTLVNLPNSHRFAVGDNYYWISLSTFEAIPNGQFLDAELVQVLLGDDQNNSTSVLGQPENPNGHQVVVYDVCRPDVAVEYASFKSVSVDNTNFFVTGEPDGFQFEEDKIMQLDGRNEFTLSAEATDLAGGTGSLVRAYIDWNHDGVFDGMNEEYDITRIQDGAVDFTASKTFPIPPQARPGFTKIRFVAGPANGAWTGCDIALGDYVDFSLRVCGMGLEQTQTHMCKSTEAQFHLVNFQGDAEWQYYDNIGASWVSTGDKDGFFKLGNTSSTRMVRLRIDASDIGCPVPSYSVENFALKPERPVLVNNDPGVPCTETPGQLEVAYPYEKKFFSNTDTLILTDGPSTGESGLLISNSISVSGVTPTIMDPLSLEEVCLTIKHEDFEELSVFLRHDGWLKEVELFGFGDLSGKDSAEVCFTWDGELPEGTDQRDTYKSKQDFGIFNNLSPNDDFSLLVYDLKSGKTGEIRSWSLTFGSFTNSWSPVEDITPVFGNITNYKPNGPKTYTATISDRNCDLDLDIDVDYWIPNIELENVIDDTLILCEGTTEFNALVEYPQALYYNYEWFVNGVSQFVTPTNQSFNFPGIQNNDTLKVMLHVDDLNGCTKSIEDSAIIRLHPTLNPQFTIETDFIQDTSCLDSPVTFTLHPQDTGIAPIYTWVLEGDTVLQGDTIYTGIGLDQGDYLEVFLQVDDLCANPGLVSFDTTLRFAENTLAQLTLEHNLRGDSICAGENLVFQSSIAFSQGNAGLDYDWFLNGQELNEESGYLAIDTLGGSTSYELIFLASGGLCSVPDSISDTLYFHTASPSSSYLKIKQVGDICDGSEGAFEVETATGYDNSFTVNWFKGNQLIFENHGPSVILGNLQNNSTVRAEINSDWGCATQIELDSAKLHIATVASIETDLKIGTSGLIGCLGDDFEFNVLMDDSYGIGASSSFEWFQNGSSVQNGLNDELTLTGLVANDEVYAVVTSSLDCATPKIDTSNIIVMAIRDTIAPSADIAVTETDICQGEGVLFTVENPVHLGNLPEIKWHLDGNQEFGENDNFYELEDLVPGTYTIFAEITSAEQCARPKTFQTESITHFVHPNPDATFDYQLSFSGYDFFTRESDATDWFWTFGELESSFELNPSYYTTSDTTLQVCQEITTAFGCVSKHCETISMVGVTETGSLAKQVAVFPNPVSTELRISILIEDNISIAVSNALGQQVEKMSFPKGSKEMTINTADWKKGIYLISISNTSETINKRIIKN